jgi:hypothetical protein
MIEPRAFIEHHKGGDNLTWERVDHPYAKASPLTTLADVLAALRESAPKKIEGEMGLARFVITEFLDQFERDQGSAT